MSHLAARAVPPSSLLAADDEFSNVRGAGSVAALGVARVPRGMLRGIAGGAFSFRALIALRLVDLARDDEPTDLAGGSADGART